MNRPSLSSASGRSGGPPDLVHTRLAEPLLSFDPSNAAAVHTNPLAGLMNFGPHSKGTWSSEADVRVVSIAPADTADLLAHLLGELRNPAQPRERLDYLPEYPGFRAAFGCGIRPAALAAGAVAVQGRIALPDSLDDDLARTDDAHLVLAQTLSDRLRTLTASRADFDVVMVHLPDRWARWFTAEGFDLHDHVKALAAQLRMPTQIVNDDPMTYHCRASVGWRLGTALYAKAGGVPYKLAPGGLLDARTVYVGLAYGVRDPGRAQQEFVVCCSQMFDAQGGGLEFVAHDLGGADLDLRNPLLTREQMRGVLARALNVYADTHAGHTPGRMVVHKQTDFTDEEVAGAIDAWGRADGLSCVSLTRSAWRGVEVIGAKDDRRGGPKYAYATSRGLFTQLDGFRGLLWVNGNSRELSLNGKNYLAGGKGTPRPVLVNRFAGAGPLEEVAAAVLALSKMDFNSDSPYTSLPVTIRYAQILARIVKTEPLPNIPFDSRLFM